LVSRYFGVFHQKSFDSIREHFEIIASGFSHGLPLEDASIHTLEISQETTIHRCLRQIFVYARLISIHTINICWYNFYYQNELLRG
jgi:hypothetical protein